MEKTKLNKVDVARRQLAIALEMWFADGDPVAIHTLAIAAHEIASHLAKRRGATDLTLYSGAVKLAEELSLPAQRVFRVMKGPANFFKHANLDPDAEIEFDAGFNEPLLALAAYCLMDITGEVTEIENAYLIRLALERGEEASSMQRDTKLSPEDCAMMSELSRHDYWATYKGCRLVRMHQGRYPSDR